MIGVPDPRYGEEICAWIKLHDGQTATAEEIREFCKGQIAHYKIPRYIEFVPEFPMTITGKIQKFVMREQTIEKLGLKAREDGLVLPDRGPPGPLTYLRLPDRARLARFMA